MKNISNKKCSKCDGVFPTSNFGNKSSSPDGLSWWCRNCEAKYKKEYKARNREKVRQRKKDWTERNRDKVNKRKRELWRTETYRKTRSSWIEKNKNKIQKTRQKWKEKNRISLRKKHNNWRKKRYHKCNDFRMRINLRNRLNFALKHYGSGKRGSSNHYGVNFEDIISHLGPRPKRDFHIDHIIPLHIFSFKYKSHVRAAFIPSNHQWITGSDNCSKNGSINLKDPRIGILIKRMTDIIFEESEEKEEILVWVQSLEKIGFHDRRNQ